MTCTGFHLHAKLFEYRIEINGHGLIKGYRMMYKVNCECLIIHRGLERWQLNIGRKSLKLK